MKEEYREAIQREGFFEGGYAAFEKMPNVPYLIMRITDEGLVKLKNFMTLKSPCELISAQAPT